MIVAVASSLGKNPQAIHWLFLSEYSRGLPEIMSGQIWRLFTPIIIHFGLLHIVFNMLWLFDLGNAVEQRQGFGRLTLLILSIAAISNLAQYFWDGPIFGGMSGVVYGLLGYVWIQGKLNPNAGIGLHQQIVVMMLIWFVLCWTGLLGNIANMAHTVGLLMGIVFGWMFAPKRQLRY